MDKTHYLMAEKNENNKGRQKGQVTTKNIFKKLIYKSSNPSIVKYSKK
jgi:hypothetical protein